MQPTTKLFIYSLLLAIVLGTAFYLSGNILIEEIRVLAWWSSAFLSILILMEMMNVVHESTFVFLGSVLIDSEGKVVKHFISSTRVWNKIYPPGFIISLSDRHYDIMMQVTPITKNPKVRKIEFLVETKILTSSIKGWNIICKWVKEKFDGMPDSESMKKRLKYELYEFNDQHSSDMAKFSNPLDKNQQSEFKKLLISFLKNRIPEEVIISKVRFDLL